MTDIARELTLADQALRAGDAAGAAARYRSALSTAPDLRGARLADAWFNLGYAERQQRRFDDALTAYARAIAADPTRGQDAHVNRAAILSEHLESPDEAEGELRAALKLAPGHPVALVNLAILHEDRGDQHGAAELYRRLLRHDPFHPTALARAAAIDTMAGRAAEVVERLNATLGQVGYAPEDAGEVRHALAVALDALGDYDAAFVEAARANALTSEGSGARANPYSPTATDALIDALIDAFPCAAPPPVADSGMIFICGMFRSGSTLAEQIVATHSRVTSGGEIEALPALVHATHDYPRALTPDTVASIRERYLTEIRRRFPAADRLTDKRPDNFLHLGLIHAMMPDAPILHTHRHPLDNLVSIYFLNFQPSVAYAQNLDHAAHWYRAYRRLMAHWRQSFGGAIHDVDYDALVADPATHIPALIAACGLEMEPQCLSPHLSTARVRTASVLQVRQPLHQRSSGRWRNYFSQLGRYRDLI